MRKDTRRERNGKWMPELVCHVESLWYDFCTRRGSIDFPELNWCDMDGCVKLFEAIDPDVRVIRTNSGYEPDTCYVRGADLEECRKLLGWGRGPLEEGLQVQGLRKRMVLVCAGRAWTA
jgi:hypothetical protein